MCKDFLKSSAAWMQRTHHWLLAMFISVFLVAACANVGSGPRGSAAASANATSAAARAVIDAVLSGATLTAQHTPPDEGTSEPLTTVSGEPTATKTPALAPTATPTPDAAATAASVTRTMDAAVAATLTAQEAEKERMATAIAATLTAQPTPTFTRALTPTRRPPPTATPTSAPVINRFGVGYSVLGREIEVVEIGQGERHIVFIGGMHAGSAPSTVALAGRAASYFANNPHEIPANMTVSFILNANPDARHAPGKLEGRLNANGVDLNRNWDCEWQSQAKWRDKTVSGGSAPFSEPETSSLVGYLLSRATTAVVFWEAKMENGQVSAGGCGERSLASQPLANLYGNAAGYTVQPWSWYPVNGDASNWLDSQGIAAVSVLTLDYTTVDWQNNLHGMRAVINAYSR